MGVTLLDFDFGPFWASTVSMTIALARLFRKGVPEAASGAKFRDSLKLTGTSTPFAPGALQLSVIARTFAAAGRFSDRPERRSS
jgi:hypothetical protein